MVICLFILQWFEIGVDRNGSLNVVLWQIIANVFYTQDIISDIEGALKVGMKGILVKTGV